MNKIVKNIMLLFVVLICIVIFSTLIIFFSSNFLEKDINKVQKISFYNNPIIPEGFTKVETQTASWELEGDIPKGWNSGLVIEDEIGNQFVWVPINESKLSIEFDTEQDYQIIRYGGFYVSRYEAGLPIENQERIQDISKETNDIIGRPVSKKDMIPWNYISYINVKESSQLMYNSKKVKSSLLNYNQWNYMADWLESSGYDIENNKDWSNCSNATFTFSGYYSIDNGKNYKYGENIKKQTYNMILSTGATERNKANNIYDLAGNLSEFISYTSQYGTHEAYSGYYDFTSWGLKQGVYTEGLSSQVGFRIMLNLY